MSLREAPRRSNPGNPRTFHALSVARATQSKGSDFRHGFTLIEMLVTLAVIGICAVLISVAMPDERTRLQLEAERLAELLQVAAAEAQLTATPISWTADAGGYRFLRYTDETGWSELRDSTVLRARTFPDGVALSDVRLENARQQGAPHLTFSPYAPAPVFSIDLVAGSVRYRIAGSAVGEVRVEQASGEVHGSFAAR